MWWWEAVLSLVLRVFQATNTGKTKVLNLPSVCDSVLWCFLFFISILISILIDHYPVSPLDRLLTPSQTTWGKKNCYHSSAARFCLGFNSLVYWDLGGMHTPLHMIVCPQYIQMTPIYLYTPYVQMHCCLVLRPLQALHPLWDPPTPSETPAF